MIVLDASAALEVLLRAGRRPVLVRRVLGGDEPIAAPHLLDLEVAQVLRRYVAGREIDVARAQDALSDYRAMQVSRYPHDALLGRVWELRANCTAY
jgi:predicted nucleic acid-binding protein